MKKERKEEKISALMALLLFAVFAVCIMFVLLTGAKVYQRLVRRDQENYDSRTAVSYMAAKVRQSDSTGCLSVKDIDGTRMLVITEEIEGTVYETRIYHYAGYICELFTVAESSSSLADGIRVLEAQALWVDVQDGDICVEITDTKGNVQSLKLSLRSGKELAL